ncbi:MAG: YdbL family protein [Nitrospirae bacterium]|nr:YdbL family protein [Nitrospirota bacterium]
MRNKFVLLLVCFVVVSCVTVNIYFPAAEVQKAADRIVEDIRIEKQKKDAPSDEPKKQSMLFQGKEWLVVGVSEAFAQINIDITTAAIRALKDSMKERYPLLKPFYEKGAIGENRSGLIEIRDMSNLNLKEKSDIKGLVDKENSGRKSLYEEIIKANKFGKEVMPEVQRIFANSWREQSLSGWWIQNDKGEWTKKK